MELFTVTVTVTVSDSLAVLERGLTQAQGESRLAVLVPLAWHLRQRDWQRGLGPLRPRT